MVHGTLIYITVRSNLICIALNVVLPPDSGQAYFILNFKSNSSSAGRSKHLKASSQGNTRNTADA